jgi:hypothetical protein
MIRKFELDIDLMVKNVKKLIESKEFKLTEPSCPLFWSITADR